MTTPGIGFGPLKGPDVEVAAGAGVRSGFYAWKYVNAGLGQGQIKPTEIEYTTNDYTYDPATGILTINTAGLYSFYAEADVRAMSSGDVVVMSGFIMNAFGSTFRDRFPHYLPQNTTSHMQHFVTTPAMYMEAGHTFDADCRVIANGNNQTNSATAVITAWAIGAERISAIDTGDSGPHTHSEFAPVAHTHAGGDVEQVQFGYDYVIIT